MLGLFICHVEYFSLGRDRTNCLFQLVCSPLAKTFPSQNNDDPFQFTYIHPHFDSTYTYSSIIPTKTSNTIYTWSRQWFTRQAAAAIAVAAAVAQGWCWHVPHILQYRWRRCESARGRLRHALQRQRTRHFRSDLLCHRTSRAGGELSLDAGNVVSCRCPPKKLDCMGMSDMSGVDVYLRHRALTD